MKRPCDVCGKVYEAKRSTSKYCSSGCRARMSTTAGTIAVPVVETPVGLAETTRQHLAKVGRLDTVPGQQALLLAYRIEGAHDGAVAGLSKELREVMTVATAGLAQVADPMDELKAARARKLAG